MSPIQPPTLHILVQNSFTNSPSQKKMQTKFQSKYTYQHDQHHLPYQPQSKLFPKLFYISF